MKNFKQFAELFTGGSADERNQKALDYFQKIAFDHVPLIDLLISIKGNPEKWELVRSGRGVSADTISYPEEALEEAGGFKENIIFLFIIIPHGQSPVYIYELKELADYWEISPVNYFKDHSTLLGLYWVKKDKASTFSY